jgi:c-di-GMP-binding flagellar brake protein YcgR
VEEKRKSNRRKAISDLRLSFTDYFIEVYDNETYDLMGRVVDLSAKGMRLMSEWPIAESCDYRCRMMLPDAVGGTEPINFRARSVWCQIDDYTAAYRTGFQFIDFPEESRHALEQPAKSFLFQD